MARRLKNLKSLNLPTETKRRTRNTQYRNMNIKRLLYTALLLHIFVISTFAQQEYYTSVDGIKGGAALKTALHNLIKEHKQISYGSGTDATWSAFYTTDAVVENGKRRVLDMYSNEKRYFGSKGEAVSGMNIEHSVAKSWWGGDKNKAYCDIHHLNPSDQTANSKKSNYPLGELTSVSWNNGVTFVGKANIDGSSQNAYEPCDEYKGDFARVFMYMFTCYQDLTWKYTWMNYEKSTYPTLKPWAVEMLLKWHKQDPVSEKEVNRNNAVYEVQGNRNPFVDYPQLADYVWGDSVNHVFHINGKIENGTGGNTGNDDENKIELPDGYKLKLFEDFEDGKYLFTPVNKVGNFPWIFEYQCGEVTSYDDDDVAHAAESWMISETLDFSNDSIAKITFDYVIRNCATDKVTEYNQLLISKDYTGTITGAKWEVLDFDAKQNEDNWERTTTNEIVIPAAYMGCNNVVIAFKYIGTEERTGTFEVDNVTVIAAEGANDSSTEGGDTEDDKENNNDNYRDGEYVLVTDASHLSIGDYIILVYENYVMGAQTNNYRSKVDGIVIADNVVTYLPEDAQEIVLETGTKANTFALNVGNGYLAATSSSSNHVVTKSDIDDNASWSITIDNNGLATIKAQGDKTRNILQYNTSSPRFSCYKSGQKDVNIYLKKRIQTAIDVINCKNEFYEVYSISGSFIRKATDKESATEGLRRGIYIINGIKEIIK